MEWHTPFRASGNAARRRRVADAVFRINHLGHWPAGNHDSVPRVRWISSGIRNALGLVLGFFALPWCLSLLIASIERHAYWPRFPVAVGVGLGVGLILIFVRRQNLLFHTFVHEACHALLCLLTFVKIRGVAFTDGRGGQVDHDQADPVRTTLIAIAPYTVPLLLGPALLARLWWHQETAALILSGVCAFLYVTHLHGLALNIRLNFWGEQADLPRVGRFLALVLIIGSLLLLTTGIIEVLWAGGAVRQGLPTHGG